MAKIKIDFDGLLQEAGNLKGDIEEYNSQQTAFQSLTASIREGWKGVSGDSYCNRMNDYFREGQKIINVLGQFLENVNGAAKDFDQIDMECANLINRSF